ncbi:ankyrin repeat domain-containing protein 26-like isoform X2 [Mastomys coucha]|uniref:ankyrin repeat domain-containing protein 26-like isoform X2 n=1 Tax=Mastomys coucha TaxID=35658 RepID=UPI0012622828|nr:ankyrin repeat domain-containing protein 26-like isoform X2 [Mastomys coucha]
MNINMSIFYYRPSLKQNEKIINDDCSDGIVKTKLRGEERQYYEEYGRQLWSPLYHQCYNEEFEVSQHEMFLENLNMNLKALHNSVAQLQEALKLQEDPQREGVLSSARMGHPLWKLEVECLKLEDSVKNQAEEIEEIENQLLREDLTGDRRKEQNEVTQSTQSLECALEQEMEKSEELEKELRGFMEVLKITGKKLVECENRELYFYEDMKNRTFEMLQHEINYLKDTWEPMYCRYLHQDINIQLTEQELLKIKTEHETYEHLHKTQGDVEKEVLTLKGLVQESMTQEEEEKNLEKVRENNNDSRMSQMILRVKSLESRLPEIKSQVDSTRIEVEKHKQLYVEENKCRKSLSNILDKTMEKLEVAKTKLMQLNQQKMTLETILSSLPVQQCPHIAKFNPAVGHNPRFPPGDASFLPASESQPVFESMRKGLSKIHRCPKALFSERKPNIRFGGLPPPKNYMSPREKSVALISWISTLTFFR